MESFDEYFDCFKYEAKCRYMFFSRKMKENETFDEFVLSLRALSADCNFDKLKASLIRDQIILGMRNKQFVDRLLDEENLDLNKCINMYKKLEIAAELRKELVGEEDLEVNAVQISCTRTYQEKDVDIKFEKTYDINTDDVTTGVVNTEECEDGADEGGGSKKEIIQDSVQGMVTSLSCRTVRIGSYRYTPKEKVHISSKGIIIVAPSLKNEFRDVALEIQLKEVVGVLVHYGKGLPVIFLYTKFKCGAYIRNALEMSEESGLHFDPMSKHDPYKRIILFPDEISEEARVFIQSLFGKQHDELASKEADAILIRIRNIENTPVAKMKISSASASITTGTECSNPVEKRTLLFYPPDKGGIPINTEANTCLAQEYGGDEHEPRPENQNNTSGLPVEPIESNAAAASNAPASVNRNPNGEKRRRQRDFCFFCENSVLNFARHVIRNHIVESEVQRALSAPKNSKLRKKILTDLRKKGNYINNTKNHAFKPMKQNKISKNEDYLPCTKCFGFYARKQLWKHKRKCDKTFCNSKVQADAQNFLLRDIKVNQKLKDDVFPRMLADRVSLEAKKDPLICSFGLQYLRTHPEEHFVNVTSRKMRELAKLLLEIKKIKPTIKNLLDALKPENYDTLVLATKNAASFDSSKERYSSPTYAMNIATSIKQCCSIALHESHKSKISVISAKTQDLKTLKNLIQNHWKFDVSSKAADDLNMKKYNKATIVPLANDLKCSKDNLCKTAASSAPMLTQSENSFTKKKRFLVPWTLDQKSVVLKFFAKHIKTKTPPKRRECDNLKDQHTDLLRNKDWLKIKVFVQNTYTKSK